VPHPRTTELLQHLEQNRAIHAKPRRGAVAIARAQTRAERWSVAEVLEHLTIVEQQIGALLRAGCGARPPTGAATRPDHTRVVPTMDTHSCSIANGACKRGSPCCRRAA
jgi:hypothetical protein